MRALTTILVVVLAGCGTPPGKNNGGTNNGGTNNGGTNNGGTNNGGTNNGGTNNPNNVQCALEPMCQPGEEQVDSCDGLDPCRTENTCAGTIYCVPAEIRASDFDQSCSFDSGCALISEGDPCACHVCPDAAISTGAATDYQNAIASAMCTEIACPTVACGQEFLPHCNDGTCDIREAKYASADEFDTSCDTPDDCMAVFEGEVCEPCGCANAAINVGDADAYDEQFDVQCHNEDVLCEPCAQPQVECVDGACQLI